MLFSLFSAILSQYETYKRTVDRHNIHVNKDCEKLLWLVEHVEVDFFSFSLQIDLSVEHYKESLLKSKHKIRVFYKKWL